jgi:hypothetical protein
LVPVFIQALYYAFALNTVITNIFYNKICKKNLLLN